MEIGEQCKLESCHRLTFLPVKCAYCRNLYCQSHFLPLQHDCTAPGAAEADRTLTDTEILKRVQRVNARRREVQGAASSATTDGAGRQELQRTEDCGKEEEEAAGPSRLPCQKAGCKRFSLQLEGRPAPPSSSSNAPMGVSISDGRHEARSVTHAAPRCDRCRGFFCVGHRSPVSHGCTAAAPPTHGDLKKKQADERKKRAQEVLNAHFPNRSKK